MSVPIASGPVSSNTSTTGAGAPSTSQTGPPKPKRRASDASVDSTTSKKPKKLMNPDGKTVYVKDGSNKTKSGRFKPGAPIDLEEQCGVINEDKNIACSRSLTCKTHGMGAKRAVPGRSKPFDALLTEFQARKEASLKLKEQRAAQAGNNANGDGKGKSSTNGGAGGSASKGGANDKSDSVKKKKTGESKAGGKSSKASALRSKADQILGEVDDPTPSPLRAQQQEEEDAPDSDDELEQILLAINSSRPKPLAQPAYPSYGQRDMMKLSRLRDAFGTAFTGRSVGKARS